ncbi:MAG: adenylyltransferase/cytidyltransferase family protein [Patescibacteria group bacterium]|nr:adenylyltransferase/cytidyltransferase family protein [Patescibacteria group bacterium]
MSKIISLNQLDFIKKSGRKLVLCGGCFDILHIGHLRFLKEAKKTGDILLVALESDSRTKTLKGINRPIHNQNERAEMLAGLDVVDFVLLLPGLNSDSDYTALIKTVKPDVITATQDDPIKEKKQQQAKMVGAKLVVIPRIKTPSTTELTKLLGID